MITLEDIKAECRAVIALADKATPGPWVENATRNEVQTPHRLTVATCLPTTFAQDRSSEHANLQFITRTRTFTPAAAKALLVAIDALESMQKHGMPSVHEYCTSTLESICALFWEGFA